MVEQVTNGIKISVKTRYNGVVQRNLHVHHAFSYYITIENELKDIVQLLSRLWEISDALNHKEIVEGEGVVGLKPIIKPNELHTYKSNCFLLAHTGSMKGEFTMLNKKTNQTFKVEVPTFQLTTTSLLN